MFLQGTSLALWIVAPARAAGRLSLALQRVSAYDAPFVAPRLKSGLSLTLQRECGKTWAMLSKNRIGLIPDSVVGDQCRITHVGRDERGRLCITVRV